MQKIFFVSLCVFSACLFKLLAQQEPLQHGIELKTHYAFLMPHHPHMHILAQRHFPVYQISFVRAGDAGYPWQALYRYPLHGLSFIYSPLSSPQYIGFGLALMPYIQFNIIKSSAFRTSLFSAAGIGYIEKPFHYRQNYKNQAIGSHLNATLMGEFEFRWIASQFLHIHTGISILHFSNGKVKTPNLGINNVGIFIGTTYFGNPKTVNSPRPYFWQELPMYELTLSFAPAIKQKYPVGGKYYFYSAFSAGVKKIRNAKTKFGGGFELFYDFSDKAYFESLDYHLTPIHYVKVSLYGHYEFRFDRFSLFFHVGRYLYALENNRDDGMIYDRSGILLYLNKHTSVSIALKKHFFKADAIECGLQMHLHKYKK